MWSDQETTRDCLGFERYVESLASVCLAPDIAPLTLGVFGSWGAARQDCLGPLDEAFGRPLAHASMFLGHVLKARGVAALQVRAG